MPRIDLTNDKNGDPIQDSAQAQDLVALNSIDLFAAHLVAWHTRKVAMLEHMLNIPDGTEFTVNIAGDEKIVTLTGDALVAFRGGLAIALTEMGTLPFQAIEAAPTSQAQDQDGQGTGEAATDAG